MRNKGSIEIDRPIDDVFRYTMKNVAEWSITVVEDKVIDNVGDGDVGTTFLCVTEDHGRRMEFQGTVTRHEPPNVSASRLVGKQFDIEVEYHFEDIGGRTRVTQRSIVTPKGFVMKTFFLCCGWMMNKTSCTALNNELASLKQNLEGGADHANKASGS